MIHRQSGYGRGEPSNIRRGAARDAERAFCEASGAVVFPRGFDLGFYAGACGGASAILAHHCPAASAFPLYGLSSPKWPACPAGGGPLRGGGQRVFWDGPKPAKRHPPSDRGCGRLKIYWLGRENYKKIYDSDTNGGKKAKSRQKVYYKCNTMSELCVERFLTSVLHWRYTESMAKISKSFRLSVQAQDNLCRLVAQTGSSETAIVELALARFYKVMQGSTGDEFIPAVPEPDYPDDFDNFGELPVQASMPEQPQISKPVAVRPPVHLPSKAILQKAFEGKTAVPDYAVSKSVKRKRHK